MMQKLDQIKDCYNINLIKMVLIMPILTQSQTYRLFSKLSLLTAKNPETIVIAHAQFTSKSLQKWISSWAEIESVKFKGCTFNLKSDLKFNKTHNYYIKNITMVDSIQRSIKIQPFLNGLSKCDKLANRIEWIRINGYTISDPDYCLNELGINHIMLQLT